MPADLRSPIDRAAERERARRFLGSVKNEMAKPRAAGDRQSDAIDSLAIAIEILTDILEAMDDAR